MKTAAKLLLALVVVLGFVREAAAVGLVGPEYNGHVVSVSGHSYGFAERFSVREGKVKTHILLGPLGGIYGVPLTATQGFVGFCLILVALLVIVPAVLTVRWKKRRTA